MQPNSSIAAERCPVMSRASPTTRETLARSAHLRTFKRGSSIFMHGDTAQNGYILVSGWIKVLRIQSDGEIALLNLHAPGEVFGFGDSLRRVQRRTDAEAATDCTVLSVPYSSLRSAMRTDASFNDVLLDHSFEQYDRVLHQLEGMKVLNGLQRLSCFLLRHARPHGDRLLVKLTFEKCLVAHYLGIKPESLSRNLAKLKKHGVQTTINGIEITDPNALRDLIGGEALIFCDPQKYSN